MLCTERFRFIGNFRPVVWYLRLGIEFRPKLGVSTASS